MRQEGEQTRKQMGDKKDPVHEKAPRKKNSNKEGQKGLEDCNKAVKEETHMRDKECSLSQSST